VGNSINSNLKGLDLSFKIFFHDNIFNDLHGGDIYYGNRGFSRDIKLRYIEEHEEDIDEFVRVLERESIKVLRPRQMKSIVDFKTPYWKSLTVPALNIRDQCLIMGDEIIESSVQVRCRYFENDLLKSIFMEYFRGGAKWSCSPRPMMLDNSFDLSYIESKKGVDISKYPKNDNIYDVGFEIMFDSAQCLRFDDKMVVNVSNENHYMGVDWLKRHLPSVEVFMVSICDNHIDSSVMPLKEGTLLVNPEKVKYLDDLPKFLRSWDIIYAPEPVGGIEYDDDLLLASKYIDINVLSLDGNKIIVNESYRPLISLLESKGFTPIPVKMRHKRLFGGGFHCITLDTVRKM
jgi:glycine amidinotransferase